MKYGLKCLMIACLSSLLVLGACSDDEKKSDNNANNTNNSTLNNDNNDDNNNTNNDDNNNTNNDDQDVSEGDEDTEEPGDEDVEEPGDEDVEEPGDEDEEWVQPAEPLENCGEADREDVVECFSNFDCADTHRCQNVGLELDTLCCVPGKRGTAQYGESCADDEANLVCASGLCIDDERGETCGLGCNEDSDCPEGFSYCDPYRGCMAE